MKLEVGTRLAASTFRKNYTRAFADWFALTTDLAQAVPLADAMTESKRFLNRASTNEKFWVAAVKHLGASRGGGDARNDP